jgi:hypothetical protein
MTVGWPLARYHRRVMTSPRVARRADVAYRLAHPAGAVSGYTQTKSWFLELPQKRDDTDGWTELLNRIFYDANARMRSREPNDTNFLKVDSFTTVPVSVATMLAWDGMATREQAEVHMPWILSAAAVSWEFSSCYFVDDDGAYDGMTGYDFCELILYRALDAGQTGPDEARDFLDRLYPGNGERTFADRSARYGNLLGVRPPGAYRRPPGTRPWVSGPVDPFPPPG